MDFYAVKYWKHPYPPALFRGHVIEYLATTYELVRLDGELKWKEVIFAKVGSTCFNLGTTETIKPHDKITIDFEEAHLSMPTMEL